MKYDRHAKIWIIFHTRKKKWWNEDMGYDMDSYTNATPVSWQRLVDYRIIDINDPVQLPVVIMLAPGIAIQLADEPTTFIDLD